MVGLGMYNTMSVSKNSYQYAVCETCIKLGNWSAPDTCIGNGKSPDA